MRRSFKPLQSCREEDVELDLPLTSQLTRDHHLFGPSQYLNESAVTFIDALFQLSMPNSSSNSTPLPSNLAPSHFPPSNDDELSL